MPEPNLAAAPPGDELKPREGVDRHRVRLDAADVAEGDGGAAPFEERADTLAELGQIVAGDRAADGEGDRLRRRRGHRERRPLEARKLIGAATDEFRRPPRSHRSKPITKARKGTRT